MTVLNKIKIIEDYAEQVNRLVNQVIRCEKCFVCCKNSSAFVLSNEVPKMMSLGVPLYKINETFLIKPNRHGRCPNLNNENKCSIYDERPMACRLFPFYLMDRREAPMQWVLYHFCLSQNWLGLTSEGRPNLDVLRFVVLQLESKLPRSVLEEMAKADRAIEGIDQFEVGSKSFIPIISVQKLSERIKKAPTFDALVTI